MRVFVWVRHGTTPVNIAEWRRYAAMQKANRKGEKTWEEITVVEEIEMQRMSADVLGKQQRYRRIGARKKSLYRTKKPLQDEEMTIAYIKDAWMNHFKPHIEKDLIGDALGVKRSPSCEKMTHIPNQKVFYVRFIKPEGEEVVSNEIGLLECNVR